MGARRHTGLFTGVVWAMALLLAGATSVCAARIASVAPDNGTDIPGRLDRDLFGNAGAAAESDAGSAVNDRVRSLRTSSENTDARASYVPARSSRTRAPFANRPLIVRRQGWWATPFIGLMVLSVVLLFVAWRSPSVPPGGAANARATSPSDVVCLACSRCHRVVDLPRHRLSRHLFCPRCGATLPRDA